jgi:hypothetical protein
MKPYGGLVLNKITNNAGAKNRRSVPAMEDPLSGSATHQHIRSMKDSFNQVISLFGKDSKLEEGGEIAGLDDEDDLKVNKI